MKTLILTLVGLSVTCLSFGQNATYTALVKQADSLYKAKAYAQSAAAYTQAWQANKWLGNVDDRYNAACSWALANGADSAFAQLNRIVLKGYYTNYRHITTDSDLTMLRTDPRWQPLVEQVKRNKEKAEAKLNKPLVDQLDLIYTSDQADRLKVDSVSKKYGWESSQMQALWQRMSVQDSVNLLAVKKILDTHGWLGPDEIGDEGNTTLFLVIQHADQATQETYLPMMRQAVQRGKATGAQLALLEDRVALGQHKKQIYGSQIGRNNATNQHYVLPLADPDNVDKRRASVGLPPLAEYVSRWNIRWNVEQYKKDLPALEKLAR